MLERVGPVAPLWLLYHHHQTNNFRAAILFTVSSPHHLPPIHPKYSYSNLENKQLGAFFPKILETGRSSLTQRLPNNQLWVRSFPLCLATSALDKIKDCKIIFSWNEQILIFWQCEKSGISAISAQKKTITLNHAITSIVISELS